MRKIKVILLSFMITGLLLWQPPRAEAVNLGPFSVTVGFCQQAQKLSAILSVYSTVMWPVVGFPGITTGMVQNTSVVLDFCNFIIQLEQLDTQDAIFFTGNYLNELTGKKWDHHLQMADRTWNLANTVYDFENKETRKGVLSSVSTHRDISDYMKTSYSWYNKTFNGKDAQLKTRGEREQEMNQFAGVAYRRAILKEALNCPAGYGNKDYEKVYSSEIKPWETKRDDADEDVRFYRGKLLEMGPKFMNDQAELSSYIKGVEDMMTQGASYEVTVKKKNEQTTKPGPIDKNTGKPTPTKSNISRDTQVWTVKNFPDVYDKFRKQWSEQWSSWVTAEFLKVSEGLLDDPRGRIEEKFKDLSYECNASKLMRGVVSDRADYQKLQNERVAECKNNVRMNQKKAENLLNYYVAQLQTALYQVKTARANIWTRESFHLGTMRAVNTKDTTEGYQQEQVSCSENLEPAEMQKLTLKQQEVENEFAELAAKQLLKQTTLMETKAQADAQAAEELTKRKAFAEQQSKRSKEDLKNNISPVPVRGGI